VYDMPEECDMSFLLNCQYESQQSSRCRRIPQPTPCRKLGAPQFHQTFQDRAEEHRQDRHGKGRGTGTSACLVVSPSSLILKYPPSPARGEGGGGASRPSRRFGQPAGRSSDRAERGHFGESAVTLTVNSYQPRNCSHLPWKQMHRHVCTLPQVTQTCGRVK